MAGSILASFMRKSRNFLITSILLAVFLTAGLFLVAIVFCDRQVKTVSSERIYSELTQVPHNHVGLLLGTGKYLGSGVLNPYYQNRINAATELMQAEKVEYIVISGDNSRKNYNEPEMMRADLIAAGVDSTRIFLDFAGFRTFDSIVRLKEIFSQDSVTVISQEFHNQRALFIARKEGIAAIGYNARDVSAKSGLRTKIREKLARVKVFADYLFGTKPKFLGPKVVIPEYRPHGT
jgi:SanA protein